MSKLNLSWPERFAVMDHFKPSDAQAIAAFKVTQDELDTARTLRQAGTFSASTQLDVTKYANVFSKTGESVATVPPTVAPAVAAAKPTGTATVHAVTAAKPETASKRVKEPQKRGRKGDKIARALQAVPTTQTPVETFIKDWGVSLAVLRQSKRFIERLDPAVAQSIGKINVRQDKATKQLMIWRETT